jgi:hypothetical protein
MPLAQPNRLRDLIASAGCPFRTKPEHTPLVPPDRDNEVISSRSDSIRRREIMEARSVTDCTQSEARDVAKGFDGVGGADRMPHRRLIIPKRNSHFHADIAFSLSKPSLYYDRTISPSTEKSTPS